MVFSLKKTKAEKKAPTCLGSLAGFTNSSVMRNTWRAAPGEQLQGFCCPLENQKARGLRT